MRALCVCVCVFVCVCASQKHHWHRPTSQNPPSLPPSHARSHTVLTSWLCSTRASPCALARAALCMHVPVRMTDLRAHCPLNGCRSCAAAPINNTCCFLSWDKRKPSLGCAILDANYPPNHLLHNSRTLTITPRLVMATPHSAHGANAHGPQGRDNLSQVDG
jgi:hypothetical protein